MNGVRGFVGGGAGEKIMERTIGGSSNGEVDRRGRRRDGRGRRGADGRPDYPPLLLKQTRADR